MSQFNSKPVETETLLQQMELIREQLEKQPVYVMVVEDDPMSRTFMSKMMNRMAIQTDFAVDGLEAMRLYNRNEYDLIFMDVQMPVMNGYETTRLIREQERMTGVHVHIIAVTAYALEEDKEKCLDAGMDDYLPKPVTIQHLLRIISQHC